MRFQPFKCNIMKLTNKHNKIQASYIMQLTDKHNKIHASYTIEGTVLENVKSIKYLGVSI